MVVANPVVGDVGRRIFGYGVLSANRYRWTCIEIIKALRCILRKCSDERRPEGRPPYERTRRPTIERVGRGVPQGYLFRFASRAPSPRRIDKYPSAHWVLHLSSKSRQLKNHSIRSPVRSCTELGFYSPERPRAACY